MDAPPPGTTAEGGDAGRLRVYEVWRGSNKFILQGRFIFGPDVRSLFLTIFLIVAPVSVFCIFVARKLMDDFNHWGISIMVVAAVFTLYDITLLLLTSGRDPGIIPRNARPPDSESYDGNTDLSEGQTPRLRLPRTKDVVINGITVKIKYCDTCMLYRPPRCSHCSICNNCVERFDHHCPWVGQCIGRRNYRFFYMFVFSSTLLCFYVFAFCWVYIIRIKDAEQINVWRAMKKTPASIALIAYSFISVWFVGGLSVFHLYLIGTNQTTYENFRYRYDRHENPYNKGVVQNFVEVFFSSIPPSKNNFRARAPLDQVSTSQSNSASFIGPNMGRPIGNIKRGRMHVALDTRGGDSHDLEAGQNNMPEGKSSRLSDETLPSDLESGLTNVPEGNDRSIGNPLPDSPGGVPSEGSEGRTVLNPLWSDNWRSGSLDISPEVLGLGSERGESNRRVSHSDSIASVDH